MKDKRFFRDKFLTHKTHLFYGQGMQLHDHNLLSEAGKAGDSNCICECGVDYFKNALKILQINLSQGIKQKTFHLDVL